MNEKLHIRSVCFQKLVINGHLKLTWKFQFVKINIVPNVSLLFNTVEKLYLGGDLIRKSKPSLYRTPSYSEMG